jgi:hypothetical protein
MPGTIVCAAGFAVSASPYGVAALGPGHDGSDVDLGGLHPDARRRNRGSGVCRAVGGLNFEVPSLVRRVGALLGGLDHGFRRASADHPSGGADALISAEFVPGVPGSSDAS